MIARLRNCIIALTDHRILIHNSSLDFAVEASKQYNTVSQAKSFSYLFISLCLGPALRNTIQQHLNVLSLTIHQSSIPSIIPRHPNVLSITFSVMSTTIHHLLISLLHNLSDKLCDKHMLLIQSKFPLPSLQCPHLTLSSYLLILTNSSLSLRTSFLCHFY